MFDIHATNHNHRIQKLNPNLTSSLHGLLPLS
jgi:hypothetical protein